MQKRLFVGGDGEVIDFTEEAEVLIEERCLPSAESSGFARRNQPTAATAMSRVQRLGRMRLMRLM